MVYRTDHVGSLIRPNQLLDARDGYHAGRIGRDELVRAEDSAIRDALDMERQAGIDIFSDGEMRRDAWMTGFSAAVEGFVSEYPTVEQRKPDGTMVPVVVHYKPIQERLRQVKRLTEHEVTFLKEHAPGPFKITMPSPSGIARRVYRPGISHQAYPTQEELQQDLVGIISGEMLQLASEGVAYVQLDLGFNVYVDNERFEELERAGNNPEEALKRDIAADNSCYDLLPDGVIRAMHLCRGSRTSWSGGTGGYDWLAERLFDQLHVDRFLLEYDTERSGGFEPLRYMPKGKITVLGLVSSKAPQLEKQETLLRRIEEAAKFCPIDQLALSPQCGFQGAADRDGAHMTIDEQRRKLELVVETARKVWG